MNRPTWQFFGGWDIVLPAFGIICFVLPFVRGQQGRGAAGAIAARLPREAVSGGCVPLVGAALVSIPLLRMPQRAAH